MTLKELKQLINILETEGNANEDYEIMIRNSYNVCGNMLELSQVEKSLCYHFGIPCRCLILNTGLNSNENVYDEVGVIVPYVETDGSVEGRVLGYREKIE